MTEQRRGESPRCDRCRSPYPRRPRRHDYGTVLRNSTSRFHSSPTTSKPLHTGGGRDSDRRRQYGLRTFRGFPRRLSHHCPTARATGNRAPPVCASRETARARDRSYDSPRGRCPQLCACRALPLVCYRARNGSTLCLRSGVRSLRSETTRRSSRPSSGDSLQISGLLVSTAAGRSPSYCGPPPSDRAAGAPTPAAGGGQALVLPDQQPHVLNRQLADRLTPKRVRGRHKASRVARRGRPAVVLQLLKGAVTVQGSSHRGIVPCQISDTVRAGRSCTRLCPRAGGSEGTDFGCVNCRSVGRPPCGASCSPRT